MRRGTAALIEVIGGLFQIFGLGHIASGHVLWGLLMMFAYWTLQGINFLLSFIGIGIVTGALTWVAFMVISPLTTSEPRRVS